MLGRMLNLNDNTFQENWRWNSHLRWLICFLGLKPFRLLGEFSPLFLGNHLIEENHIIELLNMEILLQTWMSILLEERNYAEENEISSNYWTNICWMWLQIGLIHEFNNIHFTWGDWKFFLLQCCIITHVLLNFVIKFFCCWNHSVAMFDYLCRNKKSVSTRIKQFYSILSAKPSHCSFDLLCQTL